MRRLWVGLGASLLLAVPVMVVPGSPASAVTTIVVRGTSSTNPDLAREASCSPSPTTVSNGGVLASTTATTAASYFRAGNPPGTPVPSIAPETGSRYYVYGSDPSYAKGPMLTLGAGDYPKAFSARVLPISGAQYAEAFVIAWDTKPPASTTSAPLEYVGWLKSGVLPQAWSSFPSSSASAFTWLGFQQTYHPKTSTTPASTTKAWSTTTSSATLSAFAAAHFAPSADADWQYRVAVFVGCQSSVSAGIDALTITSSKSGTRMWDYEGLPSSISATTSAGAITYGQGVTLSARSSLSSVPLRAVRCQGPTCQYIGAAETSSPAGPITFEVFPDPGWTYGIRYDGDGTFGPAQANVGTITVKPYLTVGLSQRTLHQGDRVAVGGAVGPCVGVARHLVIQRRIGHTWKKVGRALAPACAINGADQYAKLHGSLRARSTGKWQLRVVVPSGRGYAEADSHVLRLSVTKRPVKHVSAPVRYTPPPSSAPVPSTSGDISSAPPPPV